MGIEMTAAVTVAGGAGRAAALMRAGARAGRARAMRSSSRSDHSLRTSPAAGLPPLIPYFREIVAAARLRYRDEQSHHAGLNTSTFSGRRG